MASRYLMQIVDAITGDVVNFAPGLAIEIDFVEDIVSRAVAKGIGLGRTSLHVAEDIRAAVEEAINALKILAPRGAVGPK